VSQTEIILPNDFSPRIYQRELMSYLDRGGTRAVCVWHRRAGKDLVSAHQLAKAAFQRVGLYWHMLPTQRQGRKVIWDAITAKGERLIDHVFPPAIRDGEPNSTDMKLKLKSGSIYQVVGSDNYDSLVGSNPIGVVFSEFSIADPRAWDFVRPILRENAGFGVFIYTPRGYNAAYDLFQMAKQNSDWFCSLKTVEDTGVVSAADIEEERKAGMPEELLQQEFFCDFASTNVGSVLGKNVELAERQGRINERANWDPNGGPVIVSSDLGFRDTTAMWFWQLYPDKFVLIDYEEESGLFADDWIDKLKLKPYEYEKVYLPHDAKQKTFAGRYSAHEQFLSSGIPTTVLPVMRKADRINAARTIFASCAFQRDLCSRGLASLRAWSYKWDPERRVFSKEPDHDWSSHGSDAFTYGATVLAHHIKQTKAEPEKKKDDTGANYAFNLEQLFEIQNDGGRMYRRV
jgi:hypothetical protein